MKTKIIILSTTEIEVFTQDGRNSNVWHNGSNLILQSYSGNLTEEDGFDFENLEHLDVHKEINLDKLANSKSVVKDFPEEIQSINLEVIQEAVYILGNPSSIQLFNLDSF